MFATEILHCGIGEPDNSDGGIKMAKEKISMIARKYLVYDSKIRVASVAIGLPLPISLANHDDRSLIKITVTTKIMTYGPFDRKRVLRVKI